MTGVPAHPTGDYGELTQASSNTPSTPGARRVTHDGDTRGGVVRTVHLRVCWVIRETEGIRTPSRPPTAHPQPTVGSGLMCAALRPRPD
jgi:hypothetical protein